MADSPLPRTLASAVFAVVVAATATAAAALDGVVSDVNSRLTPTDAAVVPPAQRLLAHLGAAELALLTETPQAAGPHVRAALALARTLGHQPIAPTAPAPAARVQAAAGPRRADTWLPLVEDTYVGHAMDAPRMHGHAPHVRITDAAVVHVRVAVDVAHARAALEAAERALGAQDVAAAGAALARVRDAFVITETPVSSATIAALDNLRLARDWLRAGDPVAAGASLEHTADALARVTPRSPGPPNAARAAELQRQVQELSRRLELRRSGDATHTAGTLDAWLFELSQWPAH